MGPGRYITARKRSLQRLCFYRCLSVHKGEGGGVHGRGHVWRECAWWGWGDVCGGLACMARLHAWQGVCVAGGSAWQILRDTVNERAVRILLECILVVTGVNCLQLRNTTCLIAPLVHCAIRKHWGNALGVNLYWSESERNDIASRWVHRESNLMFTLSRDKGQRNQFSNSLNEP